MKVRSSDESDRLEGGMEGLSRVGKNGLGKCWWHFGPREGKDH